MSTLFRNRTPLTLRYLSRNLGPSVSCIFLGYDKQLVRFLFNFIYIGLCTPLIPFRHRMSKLTAFSGNQPGISAGSQVRFAELIDVSPLLFEPEISSKGQIQLKYGLKHRTLIFSLALLFLLKTVFWIYYTVRSALPVSTGKGNRL